MKFVKKTWGKVGVDECLRDTGVDIGKYKEGKWYPIEDSEKILLWIGDKKGGEMVERCGNYTVKDLGILSYIVRFANIKFLLEKASQSYADAFKYGKLVTDIQENQAIIKMKDNHPHKYSCQAWKGCFEGMLEMTKTKGTVEETQ